MIIPVVVVVVGVIVALGDSSSSSSISSPSLETGKGRTICGWSLENMYLVKVPDRDIWSLTICTTSGHVASLLIPVVVVVLVLADREVDNMYYP